MNEYWRWSVRQWYWLIYWPSRFEREVEDTSGRNGPKLGSSERVRYFVKMLPWLVVLPAVGNLVLGWTLGELGTSFDWKRSWFGVAGGIALGVVGGIPAGVAVGVTVAVAVGVGGGVAGGVESATAGDVALGITGGIAGGVVAGVVLGVRQGVVMGLRYAVALAVVAGLASSVSRGVAEGWTAGATVGGSAFLVFLLVCFRLPHYPVDWALAYWAKRRAVFLNRLSSAWRLCPVRWNEVIWFPLPFVRDLLVQLARADREAGLRQIAVVAVERSLQRRVAADALIDVVISDLRASSLAELADVAGRLGWTRTALAWSIPELDLVLPGLDRIAQLIVQSTRLEPSRRRKELESACHDLEQLQRKMNAAEGRYSARLLRAMNDWQEALEIERERLERDESTSEHV